VTKIVKRKVSDLSNTIMQLLGLEIAQGITPTMSRIRELGTFLTNVYPDATREEITEAENIVHSNVSVVFKPANVVQRGYTPWLAASQTTNDPYYWDRYKQYLNNNGKGHTVASLDRDTSQILDLTADPRLPTTWDRRGLVLGNVQSGKTANYTGLICKAADAGYKVIIIIAGIHNNLRNQTQERIDEGFIGSSQSLGPTAHEHKPVGVGLLDGNRSPTHFTSKTRDFTKALAESVGMNLNSMAEPGVFVIKKNASTLKSLIKFLLDNGSKSGGKINESLLLIDDEADNASINVAKNDAISTINSLIRKTLNMFERSAYVGYTATPFANIFIDPKTSDAMYKEDLFPRSFILSLDAPSDYFGPTKVFLEEPEKYLRQIDDYENDLPLKHRIDTVLDTLPDSLFYALRTFIVTRAIRVLLLQGSNHSSMLVNVSRFNNVQSQAHDLLYIELSRIKEAVRVSAGLGEKALKDPEIAKLHNVFSQEFADVEFDWPTIQSVLWEAVAPIETVTVNSKSRGALKYDDYRENGRHVIAIGGFALSRGLTLEGLTTTYFLRNSIMYDTLLQMGRWFGYRPQYQDLCRIWITKDAQEWYAHIAEAIEELRDDLRRMEQVGSTPEEFGLKVRSHPTNLIITARNKLGTGEDFPVRVSLTGKLRETSTIHYSGNPDTGLNAANWHAAQAFTKTMDELTITRIDNTYEQVPHWPTGYVYQGVPRSVIINFLDQFHIHTKMAFRFKELNKEYMVKRGEPLAVWDVFIPTLKARGKVTGIDSRLGFPVLPRTRSATIKLEAPEGAIQITSKARVGVALDESAGLTPEQVVKATSDSTKQPAGRDFRKFPTRNPLLILHFLALSITQEIINKTEPVGKKQGDAVFEGPYIAYGLSFPAIHEGEVDTQITYTVNETYRSEFFGGYELDDRFDDDDEEVDQ